MNSNRKTKFLLEELPTMVQTLQCFHEAQEQLWSDAVTNDAYGILTCVVSALTTKLATSL